MLPKHTAEEGALTAEYDTLNPVSSFPLCHSMVGDHGP